MDDNDFFVVSVVVSEGLNKVCNYMGQAIHIND